MIYHRMWSSPRITMAGTLIHNAEILTHISLLLASHVCCNLDSFICSVTLLFGRHNLIMFDVLRKTFRKISYADTAWFVCVLFEMIILLHRSVWLAFYILIRDRTATICWSTSFLFSGTKDRRSGSRFRFVVIVISCRVSMRLRGKRILITC